LFTWGSGREDLSSAPADEEKNGGQAGRPDQTKASSCLVRNLSSAPADEAKTGRPDPRIIKLMTLKRLMRD